MVSIPLMNILAFAILAAASPLGLGIRMDNPKGLEEKKIRRTARSVDYICTHGTLPLSVAQLQCNQNLGAPG